MYSQTRPETAKMEKDEQIIFRGVARSCHKEGGGGGGGGGGVMRFQQQLVNWHGSVGFRYSII